MNAPISISCVIPAWNEASRIAGVLRAAAGHPDLAEVIVVDDCSTDGTAEVVERFPGVRLLRQSVNGGKSRAVVRGAKEAKGTHLMFLDADLQGLSPEAVHRLAAPVLRGAADVSISLRGNAPGLWRAIGLDYISGERVFPRERFVEHVEEILALPRFGLEVWMNEGWLADKARIAVVPWDEVASPYKYAKMGWWRGLMGDAKMMRDIFRTVSPFEALRQIIGMRRVRISESPAATRGG